MPRSRTGRRVAIGVAVAVALVVAAALVKKADDRRNPSYSAPDPGGSERVHVPVPPAGGKLFGWSSNAWQLPGREITPEQEVDWAARTGANAHRLPFDWRYAEPERGRLSTGPGGFVNGFDRFYRRLRERRMRPLIALAWAPAWARDPGPAQACGQAANCNYPPARSQLDAWRSIVRRIATRYPDADLEIWNEPNLRGGWLPGPDPERWAELVAVAYDEVKRVNREMRVVAGGINGNLCDGCGLGLSARTFMDRAYASRWRLRDHMDALSFHPYPAMKDGDIEGLGRDTSYAAQWQGLRRAMRGAGDARRRIWVTEAGATHTGPDKATDEVQFRAMRRIYDKTLSAPGVDAIFMFTLVEYYFFPPGGAERGYGVSRLEDDELVPLAPWCGFARLAGSPLPPSCGR